MFNAHIFKKQNISSNAFTIIELLVVIAIIALISSVVLVSMRGSTGKAKIAKSLEFSQTILNVIGVDAVGIWTFDEGQGDYAYDKSGYGNRGTLVGKPDWVEGEENTPHWFVNEGEGRWALDFDGSDHVNCGNNSSLYPGIDSLTVEAWAFHEDYTYPKTVLPIGNSHAYHASYSGWSINDGYSSNGMKISFNDGSNLVSSVLTFDTSYKPTDMLNTWVHITIVYDRNDGKVYAYVNGVKQSNTLDISSVTGNVVSTEDIRIGNVVGWNMDGKIDEVRIYERALSSAEIQQHYAAGAEKHQIALK